MIYDLQITIYDGIATGDAPTVSRADSSERTTISWRCGLLQLPRPACGEGERGRGISWRCGLQAAPYCGIKGDIPLRK
ncbi:MAG: hypothetical protein ACI30J_05825 [Paludibacteraceae bacterium]